MHLQSTVRNLDVFMEPFSQMLPLFLREQEVKMSRSLACWRVRTSRDLAGGRRREILAVHAGNEALRYHYRADETGARRS
jgi:hypothetical protein